MVVTSLILVLVLKTVSAAQYNCTSSYEPSFYVGETRVPSNCTVDKLNCPPSWKSGIPEGSVTSPPMIHQNFLSCHEGFTLCGYVPINTETGEVLGQSGVTIGAGVDLGNKTRTSFPTVSSTIVDKLEPYFGLKGNLAACAAIEHPLRLTTAEADTLTDVITNGVVDKVSKQYDNDKERNAQAFASVPRGIRTAIVSVWFQFGYTQAYSKFWNFVTKNDWDNAIKELRNFYNNPEQQTKGDLRRRNNEADIIEAILVKCNRSVDVVFLLDDSGSVSHANFNESLEFVKNIIKAFPSNKLSGQDGTRFGLSKFSLSYKAHFYLSNYTKQSDYLTAVSLVSYSKGPETNLGLALGLILNDQFNEKRGLRPEVEGVPRILIVLTDGKSTDSVSVPAKNVRDENIVIYAIGIANYELAQLQEIASSESHIYTLSSFSELDIFISTLTSSTCYEPRPVSLNETVITNVAKDTYEYFTYEINESANLEINVIDLSGSTIVYVSRTNPHPYKHDNDFAFNLSTQKNKVIVISGRISTKVKRSTDQLTQRIYVSVTSDTESASFQIEANECDPSNCTEGTNEIPPTQPPTTQRSTTQLPSTAAPGTTSTSSDGISISTKLMIVVIVMLVVIAFAVFLISWRKCKK